MDNSKLDNAKKKLQSMIDDKPDEYTLDYVELKNPAKAYGKYYNKGDALQGAIKDKINMPKFGELPDMGEVPDMGTLPDMGNLPDMGLGYDTLGSGIESIGQNTAVTADNTGAMAGQMELENDDYLRDIVEREAINKFTTAEVRLDFTANANLNSDMDIDGFFNQFTNRLEEQLLVTAEGVHQ